MRDVIKYLNLGKRKFIICKFPIEGYYACRELLRYPQKLKVHTHEDMPLIYVPKERGLGRDSWSVRA